MKGKLAALTFCAALLGSQSLFGIILLDDVMSKEKQKQTGVNKLKPQEKIALENWLNDNFVLKSEAEKTASNAKVSLSMNINQGEQLILSDGSRWQVAPDDVIKASGWITPFPMQIQPSDNPDYPFLLVNQNTKESVKARKVMANSAPTPTQMSK